MIATCKVLGNMGRLGNQFFQMAATIAYSIDNHKEYIFPRWGYQNYMSVPVGSIDGLVFDVVPDLFPLQKFEGNVDLNGHFLSERYFNHHRQDILNVFKLSPEWEEHIQNKYGDLLSERTCSIHIRRGDYLFEEQRKFHGLLEWDYYQRGIDARGAGHKIVVFSDDIEWCKENVPVPAIWIEGNNEIIDLFLMSKCTNNIISNSTFSWWAAWLNDGGCVAPRQWFVGQEGWDGLYRRDWIVL